MSQADDGEDIKPKLNLTINYEGKRQYWSECLFMFTVDVLDLRNTPIRFLSLGIMKYFVQ